jgi:peptide/nickel transport system substrate-binding protein
MNKKDLEKVHVAMPQLVDDLKSGKLDRREFLRTTTLLGLSAGAAYAVAGRVTGETLVQPAIAAEAGKKGGTLRCSMNVMEVSDPAIFDWSQKGNVARQVIEPMCQLGGDNVTRPYLAESWSASDDLKTWTFTLRQGVKWNNGDDFTADDVVFNFKRWLDPATGSSNLGRFSSLTEKVGDKPKMKEGAIERVDDHTVRFHLASADLTLPEGMTDYPALIVHRRFEDMGKNFVKNPIGTGPFLLKNYQVGQTAEYVKRNPKEWWGSEVYLDGIVYLDHGDDPAAALAALSSDQVDLLYQLSPSLVPAVKGMPNLTLYSVVTGQTGVARMRVTEKPFDNVKLRQAIRACIDHARLLELGYQNLGTPGEDHHVCPIHPEYAELPKPKQDYALAKKLLGEAGYANGINVTIDVVANPPWCSATCQAIAEMCKAVGINVGVNIMPGGTYWDRWLSAPFGFTEWTHRPLGVQVLNLAYRSGVAWNETAYHNPQFDALLDKANGTLDVNARRKIMVDLEKILQTDSVIIQPFWQSAFTAGSTKVKGFNIQVANEHYYTTTWLA